MKIKWMRNINLPIWGQQYLPKNNLIFFVRCWAASTRAACSNWRSIAAVCFDNSEPGEIGARLIRTFGLSELDDSILFELVDRDESDWIRFDRLSLSGGEIESSKRKWNDGQIIGTIIYDQLPLLVIGWIPWFSFVSCFPLVNPVCGWLLRVVLVVW